LLGAFSAGANANCAGRGGILTPDRLKKRGRMKTLKKAEVAAS